MVDWYGRWTHEDDYASYPKEKWCDCDRIAVNMISDGYTPLTSVENVVDMVLLYFDCCDIEELGYQRYDKEENLRVDECVRYVKESGGWRKFDYVA